MSCNASQDITPTVPPTATAETVAAFQKSNPTMKPLVARTDVPTPLATPAALLPYYSVKGRLGSADTDTISYLKETLQLLQGEVRDTQNYAKALGTCIGVAEGLIQVIERITES